MNERYTLKYNLMARLRNVQATFQYSLNDLYNIYLYIHIYAQDAFNMEKNDKKDT